MIEYLGDDLKMFTVEQGIPSTELHQALVAIASVHAGAWNEPYFKPISEGGKNEYILDGIVLPKVFIEFGLGGWDTYLDILKKEFPQHPNLVPDLSYMFKNMGKWWQASKGGNMTIGSMDLRSENVLWKKLEDGTFECVLIDHQGWNYGAPMRDVVMLLGTSMQMDDINGDFMGHLRYYYDALIAAGVDAGTYTWEQAQDDIAVGFYAVLIFGGAMIEIIDGLKTAVAAMDGTEDNFQETKNMAENFDSMAKAIRTKALVGYKLMEKECTAAAEWVRSI